MTTLYSSFTYPDHKKIKDTLRSHVIDYPHGAVMGGGVRTDWKHFLNNRMGDVDTLLCWIEEQLPSASCDLANMSRDSLEYFNKVGWDWPILAGGQGGFSPLFFDIVTCWGIDYKEKTGLIKHNHFPYNLAFTYYVHAPENCSPLIIEGHEIKVIEGQLIVFHGSSMHWVPTQGEPERTVIAGNAHYNDKGRL